MGLFSKSGTGSSALRLGFTACLFVALMAVPALAQLGGRSGGPQSLIDAIEDRDIEAFKLALVNDVRPTVRNSLGVPAIILAVESREDFFVSELLNAGARPDDRPRRENDDRTALTRAAALGEAGMVKALLDAGADPELPGERGEPALISAAHLGHLSVVRVLVDGGADVQVTEMTGRTALELADRSNQVAVARYLRNVGAQ